MKYISDLQSIISINSYTKNPSGVNSVSQIMTQWLTPLGFTDNCYQRETIGNHHLYTTPKSLGAKILLLGHNDTVFPPQSFEGFSQDDEWVYGAGVCDMKGGNIVALEALRNIHKVFGHIENIDFLLVSDEETGSGDSKSLTASIAKDYDYCFVFEAAGNALEVVTARKGIGTFTITIEGKASHAGVRYTEGINANLEGAYKLIEITKLTNLELGTTVNVGKVEGGIGANTISPKCSLLLELRYTSSSEKERLLSSLNKIVETSFVDGTTSTLSGEIQRDVMEHTALQDEFITKIEEIIGEKLLTEKRGGVSDANLVASAGTPTLDGFGPFGDGDHTIKERALKSSFESRIALMTKILTHHQTNKKL